ncbi:MAG: rhomboid family intramembrane serine protease [Muribaculaceae bacterium]|nr:rhomboid family intramembrane serine protease [Muribaculaceae bacterium]
MMWCKNKHLIDLIAANVVISVAAWIIAFIIERTGGNPGVVTDFLALPAGWRGFLSNVGTLMLYMFTQFSFLHLVFNMLWLYWFGSIFLLSASGRQLCAVYVAGGFTGGLAYLVATSAGVEAGAYLCGSSAAVLGVMCAAGVMQANIRLRFMLLGTVRVKWVTAICVLLTLTGSRETPAASIAHLGGIAAGLIAGLLLKYKSGELYVNINKDKVLKSIRERLPRKERERRPDAVAEALRGRMSDHDRLDMLLDKIRLSGYNSLTDTERRELEMLSRKL